MANSNDMLVVFDLDGTLNRTDVYAVPAHMKALKEICGRTDATREEIIDGFGATWQEYSKKMIPDCDENTGMRYERRVTELEQKYIKKWHESYDGVDDLLDTLRGKGCTIAVCSNSALDYIEMVLRALGLLLKVDHIRPLIDNRSKADTLKILLQKVPHTTAIMVGDRKYDMQAAKENGIPFIGCLYGYNPDEIKGADIVVEKPAEILVAIEKLLPVENITRTAPIVF